jgi:PilZ domain
MTTDQVQLERRGAQRFDFHLSVSVRLTGSEREGCGFTQNLCARGALFHTDLPLSESDSVELTLVMPSEITLAENMRVRCRGKVLRVLSSAVGKSVVAVHVEGYEFLPEASDGSSGFGRISGLHEHPHGDEPSPGELPAAVTSSSRP